MFTNILVCLILQEAYRSTPDDEEALRAIDLLYDAALVSSGFTVSLHIFIPIYSGNWIWSLRQLTSVKLAYSIHTWLYF